MSDRGVSSPVGVILILGITIASVMALFAIGGSVLGDTRADAERTQMENSMSGFSSKASLVGLGESGDQRFALGRASEGQVDIREHAGNVSMYVEKPSGERSYIGNVSMGSVVYESDGREIAYQGGGVWTRQNGYSRMVSPPEFHYRSETLTFPIINVTGSGSASGDVRGTVRSERDSRQLYPNVSKDEDFQNPLTNGTVYVEIESEYCRGWQSFFEARSQSGVAEDCDGEDTIVLDLTVDINQTFGKAVTAGTYNEGGAVDSDSYRDGHYPPSATQKIEHEVEECLSNGCDSFSESDTLDPGTYYTEDMSDFTDLTLDADGDDIFVVLNDTDAEGLNDPGDITVSGDGNATVYLKTDEGFEATGGGSNSINSGGDPSQFRMYITSGAEIKLNGGIEYTGTLYSRDSTLSESGGNANITGSVVVGDFDVTGNSEFNFDPRVANIEPGFDRNTVKYLHVSENNVRVGFE